MGEIYGQYFFNGSNRVKSEGFGGWNVFVLFFVCYSPSLPLSRIAFIGQTWRMKRYTAPTGWRDTMSQRWRSTSTTPSTWWCSMNRGSPKVRHAGLWYDTDLFLFLGWYSKRPSSHSELVRWGCTGDRLALQIGHHGLWSWLLRVPIRYNDLSMLQTDYDQKTILYSLATKPWIIHV